MYTEEDIQRLVAENRALKEERQRLSEQVAHLKGEVAEFQRMIFGSKRERFVPTQKNDAQLELPLDVDVPAEDPPKIKQTVTYQRALKNTKKPTGRRPLPADLPREEVVLEPDVDTSGMRKVGEEVTEELDLVPAKLFVRRYIRPRYVDGQERFHIARLPSRPIERGIPGPGLLAQVLVDKFCHHIPFYRQVQRYGQWGTQIAASTLGGWLTPACDLLLPLYLAHRHQVLGNNYLQVDETSIKVLDSTKKGKTHLGRHWVYYSPEQKLVLFDYRRDRSRQGPKKMLFGASDDDNGFEGYLQADAFSAYVALEKEMADGDKRKGNGKQGPRLILVGCMAHARRHFEKALGNKREKAERALLMIQQLYEVEREARDKEMGPEQRGALRMERSLPVIRELGKWSLEEYRDDRTPKSKFSQAVHYFLTNYKRLSMFIYEGRLEIDNNLVENSIRAVAIGRKNYLFAGSHDAAQRAAMMYGLIGSCKLHDINPYEYLKDVLERLPDHPINKIDELLPQNWKKRE